MNDILPPKRPLSRSPQQSAPSRAASPSAQPSQTSHGIPLIEEPKLQPPLLEAPKRRSAKKVIWWCIGGLIGLLTVAAIALCVWYMMALRPVAGEGAEKTRVHIVEGSSLQTIGQLLEEKKLIRSRFAFDIYSRLSGARSQLQAGIYDLSPSESTEEIVKHLASGNIDKLSITFLPGATLAKNRAGLIEAGFSEAEVDAALNKLYDHPLFAGKPASADLEGYIYGETYTFAGNATVEQILERTFDEFYAVIQKNDLIASFEKQGLNLYEGITLASIIQREIPHPTDQKQVAQVFLRRLTTDISLGSDVTYQYAAKKLGVTPTPDLDSPYNTRKYKGLPPGPIATPGLTALEAVAAPAEGDYLYFLSGDDDVTYFAHTNEEQEANIRDHCQMKCSIQ